MTGDGPAGGRGWRQTATVALAAEALAAAAWLQPASMHITSWPVSGPVRLALLAPAWQLVAWSAAALASAAVVSWPVPQTGQDAEANIGGPRKTDRRARVAHVVAPCALLWLWVVPYLPWLPDRAPLLLVLAGPLRWIIAAIAAAGVFGRLVDTRRWVAPLLGLSRRTIFVLSLAIYLVLGLYAVKTNGLGGDEPHYLVITESLLRDGDLAIGNNHQRGDYRSFVAGELRPDFMQRGKNGEIYSIHAPGLPALLLPVYAVAGYLGAVAMICLMAALTALAIFDLAEGLAGRSAAVITWAAVCLTVPFIPHSWAIFPEMPGALVVAWAALWLWRPANHSAARWASRGAVLGTLPWLHTKFVVFLVIFAAAECLRLWRRPRLLGAYLLPMAASCVLWLYSFYAIYGVLDPEAPYGAYARLYVLTRNIPHGLLGILFDQKFGLLFYSPIYLATLAGAWLVVRRPDARYLGVVLLAAIAAFVGSTARLYMFWGGSSAPARFLVPILPCLAPLVALAVAEARGAVARALLGVWLAIGLAFAVVGVGWPARLMLFSEPHGRARVLEAIQGASPLALVVPTLTDPDWASQVGSLGAWLAAALLALVAVAVTSRLGQKSPWRLAGVGSLAFLAAGAAVSARPSATTRAATAIRGDVDVLWHYDGARLRTLDYATLARATPERLRQLTTIVVSPQPADTGPSGYIGGPFDLPPGSYDATVWFGAGRPGQGEVVVGAPPQAIFGRVPGTTNPATVRFNLPVAVRRLTVRVPGARRAGDVTRVEIEPRELVPPGKRPTIPVRAVESIPGRDGAYLVYTDENAYPEGGIFWSRGTADTRVAVVPGGATRVVLTLSTGAMSGEVRVSVDGKSRSLAMTAGRTEQVAFDLPQGASLVPMTVRSDVMFRPAEVDRSSTDMRGLGCQVRVELE